MILKLLTGGIDLPQLAATVASLDLASNETNAALADHIVKANARMTTIERVQSDSTAQCQIRMNGLQDLIASRALAQDVDTLRMKLERVGWEVERPDAGHMSLVEGTPTLATEVAHLKASNAILHLSVDALTKKIEALTAAKLSELKARKAPKK